MIQVIKKSKDGSEAKSKLLSKKWKAGNVIKMLKKSGSEACKPDDIEKGVGLKGKSYQLSGIQAQAILDMRLQRLTGLEQERLIKEFEEIIDHVSYLMGILSDSSKLVDIVLSGIKRDSRKIQGRKKNRHSGFSS